MNNLNRTTLIGNVTRDPEARTVTSGQTVATFSLATTYTYKKDGQKQEKSEFHNVVAWGKLAEIIQSYVRKGSKLYVEGRNQTRSWDGQDGSKKYRTEIVAENVIMLDKKPMTEEEQQTESVVEELPFGNE